MSIPKRKIDKKKSQLNNYSRYTGIAFQMMAIIIFFLFIGIKLDKYFTIKFPIFTLFFVMIGVVLSMYVIIREFKK